MNLTLKHLVIAALFSSALPAQAAVHRYTFTGEIDSGHYINEVFSGSFSFDNSALTSTGTEYIDVSALSLNLLNTSFSQANFVGDFPAVAFNDGEFSGLAWSFDSINPNIGYSFIPGSIDANDAYFAYEVFGFNGPIAGLSGTGIINYSVAAIPEPESYAMFLAGLGLLGFMSRRNK
jgi:hypothetical protein